MSSTGRNRSEGWRHAKVDGHKNEFSFAKEIVENAEYLSQIEEFLSDGKNLGTPHAEVDGSKHVNSILGDVTTSKVDFSLTWPRGEKLNISLKKSSSGQVWLITVSRFLSAIEYHTSVKVADSVRAGISLFIGGTNIEQYREYFETALNEDTKQMPKIAEQERHQGRLVAKSLETNLPQIWTPTLDFFNKNIELITQLSYSHGLVKSREEVADLIIYNHKGRKPDVFSIKEIVKASGLNIHARPVVAGPMNGGSTLLLPTGRLQMHRPQGDNQLQFRHEFEKISSL
jgi:hypothetical protein